MSESTSILVRLAAQGLGYVGFSVSILAWLWLTLVPPEKPQLVEPVAVDKRARRRSAPAALQSRKRNSLSPSVPQPASPQVPYPNVSPARTRRVYFLDSPMHSPSSPATQERTAHDSSDFLEKPLYGSPTSEISPSSSSSTLVHTYPAIPSQTLEICRESAVESDSSNSSPRSSLSLSRPFQKRTHRSSGTSVPEIASINTDPTSDPKPRRSSMGFVPTWSFRRASGPKNAAENASPATSSATPSSGATAPASPSTVPPHSYFSRRTARRVSTPVPRTQPYAYPYYAQPPIEDEAYAPRLRTLSEFGTEALSRSPTTSDWEMGTPPPPDQRGRNRKANDSAQSALGLGRPSAPVRPPQRSASESCAAGKHPRL